ncbi:MAG: N-acetylglucosamine-6-phosphate deacetylase [Christensenellales bacterium]|jgi:N-acetylglucosamine-6-phosphate deacetylase
MRAIVNGKIVLGDEIIEGKALLFDDKIAGISPDAGDCERIDARGGYVAPGLIDIHIHGYCGTDVCDNDIGALRRMARGLAQGGITAFLPTTMTETYDLLERVFDDVRAMMASPAREEARALGVNAEGPYLTDEKRGAHDRRFLRLPDAEFLIKHSDLIRLTTIAPELENAFDCIRAVKEHGIRIAIGHTTADFALTQHAVDAGATQATHIFNAMPTLGHRAPGAAGELIWDDRVYCELICDGYHVHPAWYSMLKKIKDDKLVLITDCTRAGGMGDGEYDYGGRIMRVKDGKCTLPDGTIAGSVLQLNQAVANMMEKGGATVCEAVRMAAESPARAIGVFDRKGSLEVGKDADIAIFDSDFAAMHTIIGGETAFERRLE